MVRSNVDHNLYFYNEWDFMGIVLIYIDNLLIRENHSLKIKLLKKELKKIFEISKVWLLIFYIEIKLIQLAIEMLFVQKMYLQNF